MNVTPETVIILYENMRGKLLDIGHISLKEEYADRIRRDCRRGVELYGADTPEYWQYVRDLAIGYWLALDRHDIFSVTVER